MPLLKWLVKEESDREQTDLINWVYAQQCYGLKVVADNRQIILV